MRSGRSQRSLEKEVIDLQPKRESPMTKIKDIPIEERWPFISRTVMPLLLVSGVVFLFYLGIAGLIGLPSPVQIQTLTYQQYVQQQQDSQRGYTLISLLFLVLAGYCTFVLLRTRHKKRSRKEEVNTEQ